MGCNIGRGWFQTPAHRRAVAQGNGQKPGCSSAVFWCCGVLLPTGLYTSLGRIIPLKPNQVALQCPVAGAHVLVRDLKTQQKLLAQARRSRSFRARQALGKAKAKARVVPPKKKSRHAKDTPPVHATLPVFLPHQMFQCMVRAGLVNRLTLVVHKILPETPLDFCIICFSQAEEWRC